MVARPRNHRYLQREGLGFRGPLALYARAKHRREIPLQLVFEAARGWCHDDGVDEPSDALDDEIAAATGKAEMRALENRRLERTEATEASRSSYINNYGIISIDFSQVSTS